MSPELTVTKFEAPDSTTQERKSNVWHRYRNWTEQQTNNAIQAEKSDRKTASSSSTPLWDAINQYGLNPEPPATYISTDTSAHQAKSAQDATVERPRHKGWTEKNMSDALKAVQKGMKYPCAAAVFGIPMGTLYNRAKRCGITRPRSCYLKSIIRSSTNWTSEQMIKALMAIQGGMGLSIAASTFNIPQTTLRLYAKRFEVSQ